MESFELFEQEEKAGEDETGLVSFHHRNSNLYVDWLLETGLHDGAYNHQLYERWWRARMAFEMRQDFPPEAVEAIPVGTLPTVPEEDIFIDGRRYYSWCYANTDFEILPSDIAADMLERGECLWAIMQWGKTRYCADDKVDHYERFMVNPPEDK